MVWLVVRTEVFSTHSVLAPTEVLSEAKVVMDVSSEEAKQTFVSTPDSAPASINDLPKELLNQIISYLRMRPIYHNISWCSCYDKTITDSIHGGSSACVDMRKTPSPTTP
jgi:hypothetical protein